MQVELHKMSGGRQPWYLVLTAANGEVLAVSEGYYSKWNAKRAAKKNFPGVDFVYATTSETEE